MLDVIRLAPTLTPTVNFTPLPRLQTPCKIGTRRPRRRCSRSSGWRPTCRTPTSHWPACTRWEARGRARARVGTFGGSLLPGARGAPARTPTSRWPACTEVGGKFGGKSRWEVRRKHGFAATAVPHRAARPLIGAPPSLPRPQDVGERRKALDFLMIAVHMAPKVICR